MISRIKIDDVFWVFSISGPVKERHSLEEVLAFKLVDKKMHRIAAFALKDVVEICLNNGKAFGVIKEITFNTAIMRSRRAATMEDLMVKVEWVFRGNNRNRKWRSYGYEQEVSIATIEANLGKWRP